MPHCYDCLWNYKKHSAGYNITLEKEHWICPECARCVICGAQTGKAVHIPLVTAGVVPSVIFFCPQHAGAYQKLSQTPLSSWPAPVLRLTHTYISGQISKVLSSGSMGRHHRVELLNRLRSSVHQDEMRQIQLQRAVPVAQPAPQAVREPAKMRCEYCGTLQPVTDERCTSCGAPLR